MSCPQIPGDLSPKDFNHGIWQSPEAPSNLHKVASAEDQGNPQLQLKMDPLCGTKDGPNYVIPTPVPKSITHFEGRLLSHSVLQSLAATRRLFRDPSHLALHELGCTFFRILPREISRGYQAFNQLSRDQVLQYSLDNSIGPYRLYSSKMYGIGPLGSINIPLCEFHHTVQF
ncbi:hypothetical protein O181_083579 [Austropuccinia psidii MF-1]|uniref:Uncharacterized protein n=1 Tax=Austropuccinia psidii MF-1 TaxID=1389203 RepID=A0A9Q3ILY1_9BASI|nr:hypothetical protein [Austropuccinia psidii MF-1]